MAEPLLSLRGAGPLVDLVRRAGEAIMAIYTGGAPIGLVEKADASPLTAADLAAHRCLAAGLPAILDLPILSEEEEPPGFDQRRLWSRYWLIDPLDGTREFIDRNGEFTVNVALVDQGQPVLGLVHLPVTGVTYLGINSRTAGEQPVAARYLAGNREPHPIRARALEPGRSIVCLVSHRQRSDQQSGLIAHLGQSWPAGLVTEPAGSSLKFCRLAEGSADIYPRLGPTSEWDTAAAQAVLEAAGGAVWRFESSPDALRQPWIPLRYNTREALLNPSFFAVADAAADWRHMLSGFTDSHS